MSYEQFSIHSCLWFYYIVLLIFAAMNNWYLFGVLLLPRLFHRHHTTFFLGEKSQHGPKFANEEIRCVCVYVEGLNKNLGFRFLE